jgi:hypothetical protein
LPAGKEGTTGHSWNPLVPRIGVTTGSGVKVTPEFDPLEVTINFGVIYVGIPYLVLYSGVILTPNLEIQEDISSCYLRHLPRQPKIQKNI